MNQHLTQTLVDSFNALADEIQNLTDRKTVLEHKLRFAHEQYQCLADKYAPAVPEVSDTLAKLQLPPELQNASLKSLSVVPLPRRNNDSGSVAAGAANSLQIALVIRDGRRAAQQLARALSEGSCRGPETAEAAGRLSRESRGTRSSRVGDPSEDDDHMTTSATSMSTVLEQDFTVEGKKGDLGCPFSRSAVQQQREEQHETRHRESTLVEIDDLEAHYDEQHHKRNLQDSTPHKSADPICAAMYEEATTGVPGATSSSAPAGSTADSAGGAGGNSAAATKCPIRFMNQHSAEEVAHYVETHKHELPRSHAVCVRRYQRNEEQIRKLDAKYGSLVGMIEELSVLHRPMMPHDDAAAAAAGGGGGEAEAEGRIKKESDGAPSSSLARQLAAESHEDVDLASNRRVETWAERVSAEATAEVDLDGHEHQHQATDAGGRASSARTGGGGAAGADGGRVEMDHRHSDDGDDGDSARQSHFDRPLKEVRVGESPSRPWGISVPVFDDEDDGAPGTSSDRRPVSPPPAPVRMPSGDSGAVAATQTRLAELLWPQAAAGGVGRVDENGTLDEAWDYSPAARPKGKCPFDHSKMGRLLGNTGPQNNGDVNAHINNTTSPHANLNPHSSEPLDPQVNGQFNIHLDGGFQSDANDVMGRIFKGNTNRGFSTSTANEGAPYRRVKVEDEAEAEVAQETMEKEASADDWQGRESADADELEERYERDTGWGHQPMNSLRSGEVEGDWGGEPEQSRANSNSGPWDTNNTADAPPTATVKTESATENPFPTPTAKRGVRGPLGWSTPTNASHGWQQRQQRQADDTYGGTRNSTTGDVFQSGWARPTPGPAWGLYPPGDAASVDGRDLPKVPLWEGRRPANELPPPGQAAGANSWTVDPEVAEFLGQARRGGHAVRGTTSRARSRGGGGSGTTEHVGGGGGGTASWAAGVNDWIGQNAHQNHGASHNHHHHHHRPPPPHNQVQHQYRVAAPPAHHMQQHPQPQMVFTGPVFIGYPVDQAVQFMQAMQAMQGGGAGGGGGGGGVGAPGAGVGPGAN